MSYVAVILAGGKGTRLRPYTMTLPKPLVPIDETPILEIVIKQLKACSVSKIILAVNHQADVIKAYFGDGKKWGVEIYYSVETESLGTVGPLKLLEGLPEHFLVMNGDILTDLDFSAFLKDHIQKKRFLSIAAKNRDMKIDYGVLTSSQDNTLTDFQEKPVSSFLVSMGVYALSRMVVEEIPESHFFGFDQLIAHLLSHKKTVHLHRHPGYWLDIGRPEDYKQAIDDYQALFAGDAKICAFS